MKAGPAESRRLWLLGLPIGANAAPGSEKAPLFTGVTHIYQESPADPNAALTAAQQPWNGVEHPPSAPGAGKRILSEPIPGPVLHSREQNHAVWSSQDAPVLETGGRGPVASRPEGHTVRQHALRPRSGPHTSLSAILANAQHLTRLPEAVLYSGAPRARWAQGSKLCSGDAGGPALL